MLPRAGELFVVVMVVLLALSFHRMGTLGDFLGRWFDPRTPKPPPRDPDTK